MWKLLVLYNNNWVDILFKSNNLSWSTDKDSLGVELSFDTMYNLEEGTFISLMKDDKEVMRGIIVKKSEKSNKTYSFSALDYGWYLNESKLIKQFNGLNGTKAIEGVCSDLNISCNIVNIDTNIKKIYNDTAISIIDDILKQSTDETGIKYVRYMNANIFTVSKLEDLKVNSRFLIGKDVSIDGSIEKLKNSVICISNENENVNIVATSKDNSSIDKYGLLQEIITLDEKNFSQAQQIADTTLKENNKVFKSMGLNLLGLENSEEIKANRLIYINLKEKNIYGWYRVKSISNTLSNNQHKLSISIEW